MTPRASSPAAAAPDGPVPPSALAEPPLEDLVVPSRATSSLWAVRLASIVTVIAVWEFAGRRANPMFLPSPTAVLSSAAAMLASGELLTALVSSVQTVVVGFSIAAVLGVALGLLIGRYRVVDAATDWLVNALYATPLVAIIPLVILWLGLGDAAKLFVVTILTVFPVLINTVAGVRNVPQALIDVSTAFAANERQVFLKIILPSAVPYMMTGLRLGIGRAIIGMVVSEFFTAITGLGALIVKYSNRYDTASMFVPIFVLMALGILLTSLVRRAEEHFAPWRVNDD